MRVIFLDFDGVMNNASSLYLRTLEYDKTKPESFSLAAPNPVSVRLIRKLITLTDAKIVVSSSWRHGMTVEELRTCLRYEFEMGEIADRCGKDAIVIGKTAHTQGREKRGQQIKEYLEQHPEIKQYLIIDDDCDILPEQRRNFVNTNPEVGFSGEDFDKSLEIFGINWRKARLEDYDK